MLPPDTAQPLVQPGDDVEPLVHPVLLTWRDICYTVKEKKFRGKVCDKPILKGLSGHAAPGSFTAILGASGSGKTTLLSVLADRLLYSKGATLTGELTANGEPTPEDYRARCAYVQQTEVFYPYSTVRETVEMSARLRLGRGVSKENKELRAKQVIQQLGLSKAVDTIVGDSNRIKGISGGEMKRVGIACEIVSSPSLIMLDEPTSGLDSSAALNVVKGLTALAASGRTVIASIHQPGSAIYSLFDRVIVLAEGSLAYFGHGTDMVEHFKRIGYSCPPMYNPADYVLQITSVDHSSRESEEGSRWVLLTIQERGAQTVTFARHTSSGLGPAIELSTSYPEQFSLLYRRIFRDAVRNKVALVIKVVQSLVTTVIMVALYSNLDGGGVVSITVSNTGALLFFITITGLFGPLFSTIQAFAPEVSIVLRERMNNLYAMAPYYVAKVLVAIPVELFPLVVGNSVAYWWLKLNHSIWRYLAFMVFTCGMTFASVGLGFMLAAATGGNIQAASAAVGPLAIVFLLLGGFYINTSTIPAWLAWLSKINYVAWAYTGLAINEFNGISVKSADYPAQPDGSCLPGADPVDCEDGTHILGVLFNNGISRTQQDWEAIMWSRFLYIVICIGIFNFLGYLVLLAKGPRYLQLRRA